MLLDDYYRVSEASTQEALKEALIAFAGNMDFPLISATLAIRKGDGASAYFTVSNTPAEFLQASQSLTDAQRDPMLKLLRERNMPVIYDQKTYTDANAGDLWESQAPFGFHAGIGVAANLQKGRWLALGMDRDKALPKSGARIARMLADLNLLAAHTQIAALRLLLPAEEVPRLTPRELETLQWIAQGKSDWAIAQILKVSEHTVDFHVRQILKKTACNSRHTAVEKAKEHGLI